MRLRIVATDPSGTLIPGEARLLERGEMTLGRDAGCTWRLDDDSRMISKIHCRIARDATGFTLRDESANGVSVDGRELAERETVRLANGMRVAFCGRTFQVEITGVTALEWSEPDAALEMADENLTITSILADITPAGSTATGVLPGRVGEDWHDGARAAGRAEAGPTPSRPEIGWPGPPDPAAQNAMLPDDWNAGSETGSRSEHVVATSTRVRLPRAAGGDAPEGPGAVPEPEPDLLAAFLRGFGGPVAVSAPHQVFMERMGRALRDSLEALGRMEGRQDDLMEELGLNHPARTQAPAARLHLGGEVETVHDRLLAALRIALAVGEELAPDAVERRAQAAPERPQGWQAVLAGRLPGPQEARYWRAYEAAWAEAGNGVSGRLATEIQSALARSAEAEFEQLSAETPRRGGTR
ncbi:FHA domain-containing protein [Xanthobacteraceae bacterium A53D]